MLDNTTTQNQNSSDLDSEEKDLNVNQTAQELQVSVPTVRGLLRTGKLAFYKISPRNTRISLKAIANFKNSGGVAA